VAAGAGLYEELIFRVYLMDRLARKGAPPRGASARPRLRVRLGALLRIQWIAEAVSAQVATRFSASGSLPSTWFLAAGLRLPWSRMAWSILSSNLLDREFLYSVGGLRRSWVRSSVARALAEREDDRDAGQESTPAGAMGSGLVGMIGDRLRAGFYVSASVVLTPTPAQARRADLSGLLQEVNGGPPSQASSP
jgi:hypothetical protein